MPKPIALDPLPAPDFLAPLAHRARIGRELAPTGIPIAFELARLGDAHALRWALKRKASVRGADANGLSIAHHCCQSGSDECLELALGAGAEAAIAGAPLSPLRHGAYYGRARMVEMLLQAMTPKERELHMPSALVGAALVGAAQCAATLLKWGADPDDEGRLNACGIDPLTQAAMRAHPQVLGALLQAGAGPDGRGRISPLVWVCAHGRVDEASNFGPLDPNDPQSRDGEPDCFETLAIKAERGRFLQCAQLLLAAGADPNQPDQFGLSPAARAAAQGDVKMLALLAQHGADLSQKNARGLTCAQIAQDALEHGAAAWIEGAIEAKLQRDALEARTPAGRKRLGARI